MIKIIKQKATKKDISEAAKDLDQYIKFVVDIEKGILTIGGDRHYQGEELLLEDGSKQRNLWGGGYDLVSKMIDYDSIINIRPRDNNPDRTVLDMKNREEINKILKDKLRW